MGVSTYRERYFCMTPEEAAALAAKNRTNSLESELKIRRELADLDKKQLEYLQSLDTLSAKQNLAIQQLKIQLQTTVDLEKAEKNRLETAMSLANTSRKRADAELKIAEQEIELAKAKLKNGEIEKAALDEKIEKLKELEEQIDKAEESAQGLMDGFGSLLKGDLTGGLKKVGKTLLNTFAGDAAKSAIGKLKDSLFDLSKKAIGGSKGAMAALGGLAASFILIGVAVAIAMKVVGLAIAVADASFEFQKITGASKEFASSLGNVANEVRAFGGTVKEVSASFQSLFTNVSDFTMMSKTSREELIKTNTVLSKLGISNDDLSKSQQTLTKSMGQTGEQAARTSLEMAALARDIGVAPSKMAADFAAAGPQLAKLGRDGVRAFKDLAVASKITGLEVSRLLAITEKFDTFEGAAEQAGKLNAALGGNFVNAMELMTATDPAERFGMIRDSVLDAGLAFDDMSYYQRKFYADAMGLQDVSELALVMSGNMSSLNGEIGKTSADYEKMAEQAAKVQTFQEKLNTLMAQLIPIVTPLVDGLIAISDWMMENLEMVKVGFSIMVGSLMAVAAALTIAGIAFLVATLPISGTVLAITALVGALAGLASLLFVESFASSFLEGLFKIGNGFDFIKENAIMLLGPMGMLIKGSQMLADHLFAGDGVKVGAEMTTKSVQKMDMAMADAASTSRATAPVIANNNIMSSAVNNAVTTTTNNIQKDQQERNIIVELDGKKVGEGVMGKFARNAAMV